MSMSFWSITDERIANMQNLLHAKERERAAFTAQMFQRHELKNLDMRLHLSGSYTANGLKAVSSDNGSVVQGQGTIHQKRLDDIRQEDNQPQLEPPTYDEASRLHTEKVMSPMTEEYYLDMLSSSSYEEESSEEDVDFAEQRRSKGKRRRKPKPKRAKKPVSM
jgi:hypothetical protein